MAETTMLRITQWLSRRVHLLSDADATYKIEINIGKGRRNRNIRGVISRHEDLD